MRLSLTLALVATLALAGGATPVSSVTGARNPTHVIA